MRKAFKGLHIVLFAFLMVCASSCKERRVYHHYEHTPLAGWEKLDTLSFEIPVIKQSGTYSIDLGLRINSTYPFKSLAVVLEQTLFRKNAVHKRQTNLVNCKLFDEDGKSFGQGVGSWQYRYTVKQISLEEGDSLRVRIRHDMKREILPGVSDVGLALSLVAD